MKLSLNQKKLLMNLIKEIDQEAFIGVAVVHYGDTTRNSNGVCQCEILADCINEDGLKTNVSCQWGIRELFM